MVQLPIKPVYICNAADLTHFLKIDEVIVCFYKARRSHDLCGVFAHVVK